MGAEDDVSSTGDGDNEMNGAGETTTIKEQAGELRKIPEFALPPHVRRFLEQPEDDVWVTDYDYFESLLAVETLRAVAFNLNLSVAGSFFSVRYKWFAKADSDIVVNGRKLQSLMMDLIEELDAKRVRKLENMKRRPIVEKLLDALDATDVQRKIFRHVLARNSGMSSSAYSVYDSSGSHTKISHMAPFSVNRAREMFASDTPLTDLMPLTDTQSVWVKQQLYVRSTNPNVELSAMDENIVRVFMGFEIAPAQYQAIGSSLLQEKLLEDENFQETATGKAISKQKKKEEKAREPDQDNGEAAQMPSLFAEAMQATEPASGDTGSIKKDRIFDVLSLISEQERKKKEGVKQEETKKAEGKAEEPSGDAMEIADDSKHDTELDHVEKETIDEFGPYKSDLGYLEDQIQLMKLETQLLKLKAALEATPDEDDELAGLEQEQDPYGYGQTYGMGVGRQQRRHQQQPSVRIKQEKQAEKLERAVKKLSDKVETKMAATRRETQRDFRLEQLCGALSLEKFEKYCILAMVSSVILPNIMPGGGAGRSGTASLVGLLIERFCSTLEEKMQSRRFFYKSSTLIREGILTISQSDFMTDLSNCRVELDRRLFDWLVGLDTEMSEIVNGSHLYLPEVNLDDVVVPEDTKKRICDAVLSFDKVKDTFYRFEVEKKITYGLGQVLLFYGQSGTGKTMLANAVATKLQKKVLLVNFPDLGTNASGAILKFLFREARINRAILFFDECESLFRDRSKGGTSVNMILTELERFDGLCILATNRAYDLDEAMHRRISLAIEFRKPDHIMREKIWRTLQPPKVPVADDINFGMIAKKFELTGGLIKNAWLQAIGLMVQREGEQISQEDLVKAASEQVIGQLTLEDFDRRVVPTCGVDAMVLSPTIKDSLSSIVQYTKAQSVLFGQWGFEKIHRSTTGISALFTGAPGTGKTMAAEAVGFDLGRPLLVVNVAELVSKWVGETGKNIEAVFADAKKKDAVLVFDEAEGLFGSRSSESSSSTGRHDTMNVGLLLQYIENFPGVCIIITNMKKAIDEAFFRRFRFVLDFEMPDAAARELIWESMIPKECPLASNVSLRDLANRYEMSGGDIKNALLRAATQAALRSDGKAMQVTMEDLTTACTAETLKTGDKKGTMFMYS